MRDLFRNKKTLIPILLGIAIIVIAIVTFIVIGVTSKKSKSRVSVVKLDNTQSTTNELGNTYGNETDNETKNEVDDGDDDEDKDFGVEEFYQEAAKKFVNGFADEDEIQDFVDDYFDPKAYIAYEDAEQDDSKFLEEYGNLDDDDERIEEITEKALNMPKAMKQTEELIRAIGQMADNTTMSDGEGNEIDMSDIDFKVTLEDISEPETSEDDENISKITITISMAGEEQDLVMVFYDEVVIYIMDSEGESFLDGVQWMEE